MAAGEEVGSWLELVCPAQGELSRVPGEKGVGRGRGRKGRREGGKRKDERREEEENLAHEAEGENIIPIKEKDKARKH